MELINATRMTAGYNMGLAPSGRELLVVVIKGTFVLPGPGEPVRLADTQLPLVMADTFTGEPGFNAPVLEVDFLPRKDACDVLRSGHDAYLAGPLFHRSGKQWKDLRVDGAPLTDTEAVGRQREHLKWQVQTDGKDARSAAPLRLAGQASFRELLGCLACQRATAARAFSGCR